MTTPAAWLPVRVGTCDRCGFDFWSPTLVGRRPQTCQQCRQVPAPPAGGSDQSGPGYRLALAVTDLRLAVEQARAALRLGRPDIAAASPSVTADEVDGLLSRLREAEHERDLAKAEAADLLSLITAFVRHHHEHHPSCPSHQEVR